MQIIAKSKLKKAARLSYRRADRTQRYKVPCGETQGFNLGMIAQHRLTL